MSLWLLEGYPISILILKNLYEFFNRTIDQIFDVTMMTAPYGLTATLVYTLTHGYIYKFKSDFLKWKYKEKIQKCTLKYERSWYGIESSKKFTGFDHVIKQFFKNF